MPNEPIVKRRAFQDVLTDLDDGRIHEQLTAQLPKIIQAVRDTNRPGALNLTLNVKLDAKNMVHVSAKVSSKMPQPSLGSTLFYTDDEGHPHLHDPRQQVLKVVNINKNDPTPPKA
jgi:hypothetical protein